LYNNEGHEFPVLLLADVLRRPPLDVNDVVLPAVWIDGLWIVFEYFKDFGYFLVRQGLGNLFEC